MFNHLLHHFTIIIHHSSISFASVFHHLHSFKLHHHNSSTRSLHQLATPHPPLHLFPAFFLKVGPNAHALRRSATSQALTIPTWEVSRPRPLTYHEGTGTMPQLSRQPHSHHVVLRGKGGTRHQGPSTARLKRLETKDSGVDEVVSIVWSAGSNLVVFHPC